MLNSDGSSCSEGGLGSSQREKLKFHEKSTKVYFFFTGGISPRNKKKQDLV